MTLNKEDDKLALTLLAEAAFADETLGVTEATEELACAFVGEALDGVTAAADEATDAVVAGPALDAVVDCEAPADTTGLAVTAGTAAAARTRT